jgi:hypothetical protein
LISRPSAASRRALTIVGRASRAAHDLHVTDDVVSLDDDEQEVARAPRGRGLASAAIAHRRRRDGGSDSGGPSSGSPRGLLSEEDLKQIETTYAGGLTAVQIVDAFVSRGVRFSEASFRKYVQQGLLPRSRRVGRKGKHRGSLGVYPAKTIRRINAVKQLMLAGHTIEEIQEQFLQFSDVIEGLEEGLADILQRLENELALPRFDAATKRSLGRDLGEARKAADELRRRLDELVRRVAPPRGDRTRGSGAAGSAEDLL